MPTQHFSWEFRGRLYQFTLLTLTPVIQAYTEQGNSNSGRILQIEMLVLNGALEDRKKNMYKNEIDNFKNRLAHPNCYQALSLENYEFQRNDVYYDSKARVVEHMFTFYRLARVFEYLQIPAFNYLSLCSLVGSCSTLLFLLTQNSHKNTFIYLTAPFLKYSFRFIHKCHKYRKKLDTKK